MIDPLLFGLSTYKDECVDAAHDLDRRRQEHETRHRRFRLQNRPATKEAMIAAIKALGPTELTHHNDLRHVPVRPVAGGVEFAPERMTVDNLIDVYLRIKKMRPVDMRVYDRVVSVVLSQNAGLRKVDVVGIVGAGEWSVRKALERLEAEGKVHVRLEKTRGEGSSRKRYYPVTQSTLSLDQGVVGAAL
jgi:hypothetical protein